VGEDLGDGPVLAAGHLQYGGGARRRVIDLQLCAIDIGLEIRAVLAQVMQ
jgi:hypothetical protein